MLCPCRISLSMCSRGFCASSLLLLERNIFCFGKVFWFLLNDAVNYRGPRLKHHSEIYLISLTLWSSSICMAKKQLIPACKSWVTRVQFFTGVGYYQILGKLSSCGAGEGGVGPKKYAVQSPHNYALPRGRALQNFISGVKSPMYDWPGGS